MGPWWLPRLDAGSLRLVARALRLSAPARRQALSLWWAGQLLATRLLMSWLLVSWLLATRLLATRLLATRLLASRLCPLCRLLALAGGRLLPLGGLRLGGKFGGIIRWRRLLRGLRRRWSLSTHRLGRLPLL